MPKIGHFSGSDVCGILGQHGFRQVRKRGSHAEEGRRFDCDGAGAYASRSANWDAAVDRSAIGLATFGVRGVKRDNEEETID